MQKNISTIQNNLNITGDSVNEIKYPANIMYKITIKTNKIKEKGAITMKKMLMILLSLVLVQGVIFASPSPKMNSWKKLSQDKLIGNVKTYMGKTYKVKKRYERGFIVELAPIREALERAGVDEMVSVEVRFNSKLVERLGTYTPSVEIKDGKKSVSFDSIPLGIRIFSDLTRLYSADFQELKRYTGGYRAYRPLYLELYFKDKNNKTMSKLYATFVKIPN